jgi:hypothetical protein
MPFCREPGTVMPMIASTNTTVTAIAKDQTIHWDREAVFPFAVICMSVASSCL